MAGRQRVGAAEILAGEELLPVPTVLFNKAQVVPSPRVDGPAPAFSCLIAETSQPFGEAAPKCDSKSKDLTKVTVRSAVRPHTLLLSPLTIRYLSFFKIRSQTKIGTETSISSCQPLSTDVLSFTLSTLQQSFTL